MTEEAKVADQEDEAQKEFDAVPEERVFFTVKMFANNTDGEDHISTVSFYAGKKLDELKLSEEMSDYCHYAANRVHRAVASAVAAVALEATLSEFFSEENDDSSKDNGGGSAPASAD